MNQDKGIGERIDLRTRLFEELRAGTPRALRAKRFADTVVSLMQDFIPRDRECTRRAFDVTLEAAFAANVEIVNVPPEWDALDKLQIEAAMLEAKTRPLIIPSQ